MEITVTRKTEGNRFVSEFKFPEQLWGFGDIHRNLIERLRRGGFRFDNPETELRIRKPCITLIDPNPVFGLPMAERSVVPGIEDTFKWIAKHAVALDTTALPSGWEEGVYQLPVPAEIAEKIQALVHA